MRARIGEKACYKETRTYARADGAGRALIERYADEQGISGEQLFYQLHLNDLMHELSDDERRKAAGPGEAVVVSAIVLSLVSAASMRPVPVFVSTAFLFAVTILFFTGRFDPYEQERRKLRTLLGRDQKGIEAYDEWVRARSS